MARMNMIQAIQSAMDIMLERDSNTVVFGEDVGYFGGVFRVTEGLQKKHGLARCFDAPITEGGIIAIAIGMGAYGLRPIAEIQFADYILPAFDQLVSEAARLRYRSGGEFWAPITVRAPYGGGIFGGQTHSQSPEAIFTHVCGLKTVIPSNPIDAKGLLIAAIEDDDPVVFFEPKRIYNGPFEGYHDRPLVPWSKHDLGEVPEGYYRIELGKASIVRPGTEVTILAYGTMVHVALAGVAEAGVDAAFLRRRQGDMDHRAVGEHRHRRALAADRRLAQRHGVMAFRNLGELMLRPGRDGPVVMAVEGAVIEPLRLQEDHRVGVLDRRDQQALGVIGIRRDDRLQA